MRYSLLSMSQPAPEGFAFEPAPNVSRLRRGLFCLYSDDSPPADSLLGPLAGKVSGIVAVPGVGFEWVSLGPFCYKWTIPRNIVGSLAYLVRPHLELIERALQFDDNAKAQAWDAQRAAQDRLFLSRVQLEFRDSMMRAEKELRAAHGFLNQIIEFLPDATMVVDGEKKIIAWNRAMENITGVDKKDIIGKGDFAYAIPFYGERRPVLLDLLYISESELRKSYDYVKHEGNFLFGEVFVPKVRGGLGAYLLGSASLLHDQEGKIIGAIETIRDITDRKKVEIALRESHAQLDAMANNVPGIVFQFHVLSDGTIGFDYLSTKATDIIGLRRDSRNVLEEFSGRVHDGDRQRFLDSINEALRTACAWEFEGRLLTVTGEVIWCRVYTSAAVDQNRLVYSGVVVDVTDRHLAMEEMLLAKRAAEEANKAQSSFLSNVSHEIRTPLNGIIGFSELILRERDPDAIHAMTRTLLHESEILLSLVNELLDQARIESGKMEIERSEFDVAELIDTVSKTVGVLAKNKGIEINIDTARDVPRHLVGDGLRISQVLLNLMNNSMKFTERGSVSLRTNVEKSVENALWIRFEVIDTGMGIPEDKRHLIFERFAQIDAAATRKFGGTGIGLSVSRGLVELMDGTIGFESRPGKGCTFWFVVPFTLPDGLHEITAPPDRLRLKACPDCPILLVEDYAPNQEIARMHLQSAGYKVAVAADGIAALRSCETGEYSLICMDVQMPGMDGCEATRRLRAQNGWTRHVVIMGLTANADEKTRKECLLAGMDGVIVKPLRRESFLDEVARRLSGKIQSRSCPPAPAKPADENSPMNYELAVREFCGEKEVLNDQIAGFIASARKQCIAMEGFLRDGDGAMLRGEAHKIKGGASNLTAQRLSDAARALEDKCTSGDVSGGGALLAAIGKELDALDSFFNGVILPANT